MNVRLGFLGVFFGLIATLMLGVLIYDVGMRRMDHDAVLDEMNGLRSTKLVLIEQQRLFLSAFQDHEARFADQQHINEQMIEERKEIKKKLDILLKLTPKALNEYKTEARKTRQMIEKQRIVLPQSVLSPSKTTTGFPFYRPSHPQ